METPENQFKRALNPWFSIWTKPRDTMKEIFISKPKNVFLLILLGSFVQTLDRASSKNMADSISSPVSIISMVIFGTFVAFLIYYFCYQRYLIGWQKNLVDKVHLKNTLLSCLFLYPLRLFSYISLGAFIFLVWDRKLYE